MHDYNNKQKGEKKNLITNYNYFYSFILYTLTNTFKEVPEM